MSLELALQLISYVTLDESADLSYFKSLCVDGDNTLTFPEPSSEQKTKYAPGPVYLAKALINGS